MGYPYGGFASFSSNANENNMNIIIPIKQVPETSNVRMDEKTGTMVREGVESIINPLDLYAIETGIQLREKQEGKITVITMGPQSAEKSLKEAIAMGCDDGILVTGREFAGSDTWATSYVLSKTIERIGSYDLILTGARATDGETGQVGPGIASFLNLPLATYTSRIVETGTEYIMVERLIEDGYETLQLRLPALLAVVKEIVYPRLPTLRGKQKAKRMNIPVWSKDNMGLDESNLGLKGSPTRVEKIYTPIVTREGTVVSAHDEKSLEQAVNQMLIFMQEKNIII